MTALMARYDIIKGAVQYRANDLQQRYAQHALSVSRYEAGHLFNRLQLLFTHGIQQWSDADILLFGERHARKDLTRWFVSHFAFNEPLLVCVEGVPSMSLVKDPQSTKSRLFDERNMKYRKMEFMGWDAEAHLMPQGNSSLKHHSLLSRQYGIIDAVSDISKRVNALYTYWCETNEPIEKGALDPYQKLNQLQEQFVARKSRDDPFDYLSTIEERSALLMQIIEISYELKIIVAPEYVAISSDLRFIIGRLQSFYKEMEWVQTQLDRGRVTDQEIIATFPARTAAMIATVKNIGAWMARGMTGKALIISGMYHLRTGEEYQAEPELCLDSLYEELQNHKVAVIVQTL